MKLTIVIPALNEEQAIASTIERSLSARETICRNSPVEDVEVIVVSDGSTDRTAEIARRYDDCRVIVFERNQGYGAAIKRGFAEGSGDLVGFLDADGTCDPAFFATLCRELCEREASVAIGSRLGPQSRMPRVRRLGNRIYALILSMLSNRIVTDTASGMRVIRRDALEHLYPLPNGLHFTPAMSARVLMDDELSIVECPMSYEERIGDSKLSVFRDGVRFLHTILAMTLMWQPARLFTVLAAICGGVVMTLAVFPIEQFFRTGSVAGDAIYRLLFCSFVATVGASMLSAGVISEHVSALIGRTPRRKTYAAHLIGAVFTLRGIAVCAILAFPVVVVLVGPGLWTRLIDGVVTIHWSRAVIAGAIAFALIQQTLTTLVVNLIRFHLSRSPQRVVAVSAGRGGERPFTSRPIVTDAAAAAHMTPV